jgi:hypothetical protein
MKLSKEQVLGIVRHALNIYWWYSYSKRPC